MLVCFQVRFHLGLYVLFLSCLRSCFSACPAALHLVLLLSGFSGVDETWMLIKITEPHHF